MKTIDICWLAGLLEGEGYFHLNQFGTATIRLAMTDLDVVIRAASLLGAYKVVRAKELTKGGKPVYYTGVHGQLAVRWMMTLYCLLGSRRQERVRHMLTLWCSKPKTNKSHQNGPRIGRGDVVWARP